MWGYKEEGMCGSIRKRGGQEGYKEEMRSRRVEGREEVWGYKKDGERESVEGRRRREGEYGRWLRRREKREIKRIGKGG